MSGLAISTATLTGALRAPIQQIQSELTQAQGELATGRHADIGLRLGARTSDAVALHGLRARFDAFADGNAQTSTRLSATQTALTAVSGVAQSLQKDVVAALAGLATPAALANNADTGLSDVIATLNTAVAGDRVFAGINTDAAPFADDGGSGRAQVAATFTAAFGIAPGDTGASAITPAAMQSFLDGAFATQFGSPAWQSDWSRASDTPITTRVSPTQVMTTSVTANDQALRGIVQVSAMLSGIGLQSLSAATRDVVLAQASKMLGRATGDIAALQGAVGTMQNVVTSATDSMKRAGQFVDTRIGTFEDADPAEIAARIASLTTQLESAYSLTGKISQLSLVKFLP